MFIVYNLLKLVVTKKRGPWTVVDTKKVYKNPWIDVREDKVIKSNGKRTIYGIVTMKPGVTMLPIDNQGNIYLVEQYRYAVEKKTIEAASGGIDNTEKPLDSAKRELREETGIEAKEWIEFGYVDQLTSVVYSPSYLFLAKNLIFLKAKPDGTEYIKLIKVSLKKAVEWIEQGLITNSATIALVLKAKFLC